MSIDLWAVLVAAAVIIIAIRVLRRLRGGPSPDTTITFGHADPEPVLDDAHLIQQADDPQGTSARSVVPELIDVLTVMETNLGGLDAIDYRSLARQSDGVPTSVRQLATETFGRIRHLDQATVPFLPDELPRAWGSLLQLLTELRQHGHGSAEPWPDVVLDRNRRDVLRYLAIVREALTEFARSGDIAAYREPPDLRRSTIDAWEPN